MTRMSSPPSMDTATARRTGLGRRQVLTGGTAMGVAASALAASAPAAPALASGARRWRMVTSWPASAPGPGTSAQRLAERITRMSGGRLTVTLYAAGELVPAFEVFDAVSLGLAEMAHSASIFWSGKAAASVFFTTVPWGLTPESHNAWVRFGGGQALWDELYAPFAIKPFMAGNSGVQMGGWYQRELENLDDLRGLRLRIVGLGGEILRRLGGSPVSIPPGEILDALNRGTIDGAEFLGPLGDIGMGLNRAARYYYWPGVNKPNGTAECLIGRAAFEALPDDLKAIVESACAAENDYGLAESDWHDGQSLRRLVEQGTILRRFPDDILAASHRIGGELLDELGAADALSGRILQSYRAAQDHAVTWAKVSRHAILDAQLHLAET